MTELKFGPNTEAIKEIIERLKTMTPDEAKSLTVARDSIRGEAMYAAVNAAREAAHKEASDATWIASRSTKIDLTHGTAWGAVVSAILAILARDNITTEQFGILYGPWKQIMEDGR